MPTRRLVVVGLVLVTLGGYGCSEGSATGAGASDAGGAGRAGAAGGSGAGGGAGTSSGGAGGADVGVGAGTDAGSLGPTASVRVVNLVPGVTFDAFGPNIESRPVKAAEGIAYGTVSDYFQVRINPISMAPIFVLWKSGAVPAPEQTFSMLLDDTPDRIRIDVRELDGEGEHASIVVAPIDATPDSTLAYRTLDETDADRGGATEAHLRITTYLEGIAGGVVAGVSVAGESCLFVGSTAFGVLHSVAPGAFDLTVHDLQSAGDCTDTAAIATFPLNVAAGDNELVVMYLDAGEVQLVSAPIAPLE